MWVLLAEQFAPSILGNGWVIMAVFYDVSISYTVSPSRTKVPKDLWSVPGKYLNALFMIHLFEMGFYSLFRFILTLYCHMIYCQIHYYVLYSRFRIVHPVHTFKLDSHWKLGCIHTSWGLAQLESLKLITPCLVHLK